MALWGEKTGFDATAMRCRHSQVLNELREKGARLCVIAPWIVAARWRAARAALRSITNGAERVVELILEHAFCDQAPGVWCVQHAPELEADSAEEWPIGGRGRDASRLYGVDSGPYADYIQRSLLLAREPIEVVSYAWMACAEWGTERIHREAALDQEGITPGFVELCETPGCAPPDATGRRMGFGRHVRAEKRRSRVARRHPGVAFGAESEAGRWFADQERPWRRLWAEASLGPLLNETFSLPDGRLGCRAETDPSLGDWGHLEV